MQLLRSCQRPSTAMPRKDASTPSEPHRPHLHTATTVQGLAIRVSASRSRRRAGALLSVGAATTQRRTRSARPHPKGRLDASSGTADRSARFNFVAMRVLRPASTIPGQMAVSPQAHLSTPMSRQKGITAIGQKGFIACSPPAPASARPPSVKPVDTTTTSARPARTATRLPSSARQRQQLARHV